MENQKTETPPAKTPRTRSPNYPSMSLRTALDKVQAIWNAQQKHPAHVDAVFATIGFTKKTGPSMRAVSALNQFGLTRETGSVDSRMIALSELAINYLHSNDDQQRKTLLSEAALKPKIFQHLWEQYGRFLPNDDTIKNHLVRDKDFNSAAVGELVSNYRDTFDFAQLRDNGSGDEKSISCTTDPKTPIVPPPIIPKQRHQTGVPPMTEGLRYLSIPLDTADAAVPLGMSKSDWKIFIETLKVFKSRIVKDADASSTEEADAALDELAKE